MGGVGHAEMLSRAEAAGHPEHAHAGTMSGGQPTLEDRRHPMADRQVEVCLEQLDDARPQFVDRLGAMNAEDAACGCGRHAWISLSWSGCLVENERMARGLVGGDATDQVAEMGATESRAV